MPAAVLSAGGAEAAGVSSKSGGADGSVPQSWPQQSDMLEGRRSELLGPGAKCDVTMNPNAYSYRCGYVAAVRTSVWGALGWGSLNNFPNRNYDQKIAKTSPPGRPTMADPPADVDVGGSVRAATPPSSPSAPLVSSLI